MPYHGMDGNVHWTEEEIRDLYKRLDDLETKVLELTKHGGSKDEKGDA